MLRKLVCFLLASSAAALLPPSHATPRRRSVAVDVETEMGAAWAMGATSVGGPDWLSGSEVITTAEAPGAGGPTAVDRAREFAKASASGSTSLGSSWAMGAYSDFSHSAPATAVPAKAVADDSIPDGPTAVDRAREFAKASAGGSTSLGSSWAMGAYSDFSHSAPATAVPAKAVADGSMSQSSTAVERAREASKSQLGSSWAMGAYSDFSHSAHVNK